MDKERAALRQRVKAAWKVYPVYCRIMAEAYLEDVRQAIAFQRELRRQA